MSPDDVERVARALAANDAQNGRSPILHYEQYSEMWSRMASAALSAMPGRDELLREAVAALEPFAAQTHASGPTEERNIRRARAVIAKAKGRP